MPVQSITYNPFPQIYTNPYKNQQTYQQQLVYPNNYTYPIYQPKNYITPDNMGVLVDARWGIYPPCPQKFFNYRQDELPYVNNPNKTLREYLLEKKDYSRLVEYQDSCYNTNKYLLIGKYLSTPDFKELAESKYFDGIAGYDKLISIITGLAKKQREAYQLVNTPQYQPNMIPDMNALLAGFDVGKAIENINKFFNSNLSEDLKQFILKETDKFEDLYWVSVNLSYLDKENPDVDNLSRSSFPIF